MRNSYVGLIALALTVADTTAATYWVATNGNDAYAGTSNAPFATPQKAVTLTALTAGDTIHVRGGTYVLSSQIKPGNKHGTAGNTIKFWAYPGEKVVFDLSAVTARGLELARSYWHIRGFEVANVQANNGIVLSGCTNSIIEGCVAHDCGLEGIKITGAAVSNLVLNCDAYRNYDASTHGENADGFAAKSGVGAGNVFSGCRAWYNSDDGWDFYGCPSSVTVTNCWAFLNGINLWNDGAFAGDGNGFKLGSGDTAEHLVVRCLAFDHPHKGYHQNHNTAGQTIINCSAYNNEYNYNFNEAVTSGTLGHHVLKNNISYLASRGDDLYATTVQVSNSWQGFNVSAADFVSLDTSTNIVLQPRHADYSLPDIGLLHLVAGSDLIDGGVNAGLPFNGSAPDLGAYEFGGLSPRKISLASPGWTNGGFRLQVNGLTSHGPVIVYASTNVMNWNPIFTNPPVSGLLSLVDSSATNLPFRFYRATEQ
jgi:parallel beta-helix repeat protein